MHYDVLGERFDYEGTETGKKTYNEALFDSLQDEVIDADIEVDFTPVVASLLILTKESDYEQKHKVLSNLGYLLSHNSPSLEGYNEKLAADKDFADKLVLFWQVGESDENVVDVYIEKAKKLLK